MALEAAETTKSQGIRTHTESTRKNTQRAEIDPHLVERKGIHTKDTVTQNMEQDRFQRQEKEKKQRLASKKDTITSPHVGDANTRIREQPVVCVRLQDDPKHQPTKKSQDKKHCTELTLESEKLQGRGKRL